MYIRPRTLDEAVIALASHPGRILAGGTDVFPSLGDSPLQGSVVDISGLRELKGIQAESDYFRIGGLTTWTELLRTPLPRCFDGLKAAAREIGSVQIQNRGTVAGNLCNASPAADSVPPFMTLDAQVELVSNEGRRRLPLAEFLVGNRKTLRRSDEVLVNVMIPRGIDDAASAFWKLGARRYLVISIAMVAVIVKTDAGNRVTDARIGIGSCSAVAQRLKDLERTLVGIQATPGWSSLVLAKHLGHLSPISDVRASAEYRKDAALQLVRRALEACAESNSNG